MKGMGNVRGTHGDRIGDGEYRKGSVRVWIRVGL